MKLLNYFLAIVSIGFFASCSGTSTVSDTNTYHIVGEISNAGGKTIYLDRATLDGNIAKDTAILDAEGKFEMRKPINDEGIYVLRIDQQHSWAIYLEKGTLEVKADYNDIFDLSFKGSKGSNSLANLIQIVSKNGVRVNEINQEFNQARISGDMQKVQQLQQEYFMLEGKKTQLIKAFVDTVSISELAVFATSLLNLDQEMAYVSTKIEKFSQDSPNSPMTKSFLKKYNAKTRLAIGGSAPEFVMKSPEGKNIGWKDVDGEVILLDFWASWCRPCRMENPNLVRTYNKYKEKGFSVYSISLDKDMQKWVGAIKQDGLTWPYHGSELKGWACSISRQFEVRSIPATYLINKEGKILGKDLRGVALENKLKEIYGL